MPTKKEIIAHDTLRQKWRTRSLSCIPFSRFIGAHKYLFGVFFQRIFWLDTLFPGTASKAGSSIQPDLNSACMVNKISKDLWIQSLIFISTPTAFRPSGIENVAEQVRPVDHGVSGIRRYPQVESRNSAILPQHMPDISSACPPDAASEEGIPDRGKGKGIPGVFEEAQKGQSRPQHVIIGGDNQGRAQIVLCHQSLGIEGVFIGAVRPRLQDHGLSRHALA